MINPWDDDSEIDDSELEDNIIYNNNFAISKNLTISRESMWIEESEDEDSEYEGLSVFLIRLFASDKAIWRVELEDTDPGAIEKRLRDHIKFLLAVEGVTVTRYSNEVET